MEKVLQRQICGLHSESCRSVGCIAVLALIPSHPENAEPQRKGTFTSPRQLLSFILKMKKD